MFLILNHRITMKMKTHTKTPKWGDGHIARPAVEMAGRRRPALHWSSLFLFVLSLITFDSRAVASDLPAHEIRTPVLVELFTSEGCSSCPPADALLGKLDGQPIPGTQLIVLSEHVDYWDHDGWKDAYSSRLFTERQEDYVRRFKLNSAFTPQMVIDGANQTNGSNGPAVASALKNAVSQAKIPLKISSISVADKNTLQVHLVVSTLPADSREKKADIFIAVALDHAESHVSGGENKGRDIRHVAVAESINKVGTVDKTKNFDRDVQVKVQGKVSSTVDLANLRLIAFVQAPDAGPVLGASLVSPSTPVVGSTSKAIVSSLIH
jgi:hypothetical protein